jgi:hypothetical protein
LARLPFGRLGSGWGGGVVDKIEGIKGKEERFKEEKMCKARGGELMRGKR